MLHECGCARGSREQRVCARAYVCMYACTFIPTSTCTNTCMCLIIYIFPDTPKPHLTSQNIKRTSTHVCNPPPLPPFPPPHTPRDAEGEDDGWEALCSPRPLLWGASRGKSSNTHGCPVCVSECVCVCVCMCVCVCVCVDGWTDRRMDVRSSINLHPRAFMHKIHTSKALREQRHAPWRQQDLIFSD